MNEPFAVPFISKNGIRGTVMTVSRLLDDEPEKSVTFETGRQAIVGREHLHLRQDGSYYLDLNVDPRPPDATPIQSPAAEPKTSDFVIPIAEEEMVVGKRVRETGRVRVSKTVTEVPESFDASIVYEDYVVEHVPINREVTETTASRVEGSVTIIPVYEEELVVTKRLILREEIHLTKRRREEHHPGTITLRKQQARIERIDPQSK